jgi:O-antigen ligase
MENEEEDSLLDKLLFWSLCSTFFFIPIATSPAVIAGLVSLAIWIFSGKMLRERHKWLHQSWTAPVIVFVLLPWVGLLWTNDLKTGLDFAGKSYYWLFAFAIFSLDFHKHQPKTFINAYLVGLSFTTLIGMLQLFHLIPMKKGFATGFFGGGSPYITLSLLLVFGILIVSFYYHRAETAKPRLLLIGLMVMFFLNIVVIPGRSGYLSLIFLSPVILKNIFGKRRLLISIAIAILILPLVFFLSPVVQNSVKNAVHEVKAYYQHDRNTSVGMRLYMWDKAARMFLEKPIIGVGTGGFKKAIIKYKDDPSLPDFEQPHNSFLYMAASFGIIGIISLLWLFAVFLIKGWRSRNDVVGFSVLSFGLVLIIGSLTDTQILSLATAKMFALLMGVKTGPSDNEMNQEVESRSQILYI